MNLTVEVEREEDGRWVAEVTELPGAWAYGGSLSEAQAGVQTLVLKILVDRASHGEAGASEDTAYRFSTFERGQMALRGLGTVVPLPRPTAKDVLGALLRRGWSIKRQSGDHRVLGKPDMSDVVFPFADALELGRVMLGRIWLKTGVTPEDSRGRPTSA